MTISSVTTRNNYLGTGITGPYAYNFRIFAAVDLVVTRTVGALSTVLAYPTDYSVTGVGNRSGGSITLTAALAAGAVLTIERRLGITQGTALKNQGAYYPEVHEAAFDRATMVDQQQQDQLDRSLRLASTFDPALYDMTLRELTAGKVVTGTGTGLTMSTLDSSAVALPGEGRTVATLSAYLANNAVRNIVDFGADATGTANSYAAIVAAIAAIPSAGGVVWIPAGTFKSLSNITITGKSNLTIAGPGTLSFPSATSGQTPLTITGTNLGTTSTLSVAASEGAMSITVTSAAALAALGGEMAMITSTERWSDNDTQYVKGELIFIDSVNLGTNVLTLKHALKDSYAVAGVTATVTRLSKITDVRLEGFTLQGPGAGAHSYGLTVAYADGITVSGVKLTGCEDIGLALSYCHKWTFTGGCRVIGSDGAAATPGYAYEIDNMTQHGTLDASCYAEKFRHAFTCGSTRPCWDFTIAGHFVRNSTEFGAIETHMNGSGGNILGAIVNGSGHGIGLSHRRGTVVGCVLTGLSQFGIYFEDDGILDGLASGNKTRGVSGVVVGAYPTTAATAWSALTTYIVGDRASLSGVTYQCILGHTNHTPPDTTYWIVKRPGVRIVDHDHEGMTVRGTAFAEGFTISADYTQVVRGRFKNITRNLISGSNCVIDGVEVIDVRLTGTRVGFQVSNNAANTKIRRAIVRAEISGEMQYAVYVEAGCTDTEISDSDLSGYYGGPILDSGTRTVMKRNIIAGRRQSKSIVASAAAITNATTVGKIKTAGTVTYELNGLVYVKAATDNFWTPSASANTTAGQFRKLLLCIDTAGAAVVVYGDTAASQAAALLPNWDPWDACPVGYVEIPNSYTTGGTLAGFTFVSFGAGKIE